jgi:hypothetical protein
VSSHLRNHPQQPQPKEAQLSVAKPATVVEFFAIAQFYCAHHMAVKAGPSLSPHSPPPGVNTMAKIATVVLASLASVTVSATMLNAIIV